MLGLAQVGPDFIACLDCYCYNIVMANKLKFSDALRLSWSNVAEHKGRSAIIVLTISVLFGVLMGVNFIINGLEKTLYSAALAETEGEAYLVVAPIKMDRYQDTISDGDDLELVDLQPSVLERDLRMITDVVQRNHGEMIGETWYYQLNFPYQVVKLSEAKNILDGDLTEIPEGKVPVLLPASGIEGVVAARYDDDASQEELRQSLEEAFYQVGTLPISDGSLTMTKSSLLNMLLSIIGAVPSDGFYLVDDGSGRVEKFMLERMNNYLESSESAQISLQPAERWGMVVKFANVEQMIGFVTANSNEPMFSISGWNSNVVEIFWSMKFVKTVLLVLGVVSLVVAVIIAVMTFAHLIDQDAATIALYRSMGASMGDVHMIYFLYLLELCILAVGACLLIALGMVLVVTLLDAGALAERLHAFYNLSVMPKVWLLGFDGNSWMIIVAMLVVAPVSLVFAQGHFSSKNIAKQLKAD